MITTLVILAVTSNVVLSLGMVGALSIVRFRTAITEQYCGNTMAFGWNMHNSPNFRYCICFFI
jgi:hypothetical protein